MRARLGRLYVFVFLANRKIISGNSSFRMRTVLAFPNELCFFYSNSPAWELGAFRSRLTFLARFTVSVRHVRSIPLSTSTRLGQHRNRLVVSAFGCQHQSRLTFIILCLHIRLGYKQRFNYFIVSEARCLD